MAKIDQTRLRRLASNTRPEATAQHDAAEAAGNLALEHMMLHLRHSPEQRGAEPFLAPPDGISRPALQR